jgi:elongation factor Ts
MADIRADLVKQLREKTGAPLMECKTALQEAHGDLTEAEVVLRKRGVASAARKAGRTTGEGSVGSYIHAGGKIGVLVEVNCESDFVARTPDFQQLVHDIAMHIAAADPRYIRREEVPAEVLERERDIARARADGKPPNVVDRIVEGQLNKYYEEYCLLDQHFIKEPNLSVSQLIAGRIAKLGENIVVRRFSRFKVGEHAGGAPAEPAAEGAVK